MRVALFTDTFLPDVNGVARTLARWSSYLESQGAACKIFAPSSLGAEKPDSFGVERFYSIPFVLYPECRLAIPNPLHVRRALQDFQPTIIHCATPFNLGLLGMNYARKHQIPLVASYHTHFDQYINHYKMPWIEPALWKYLLWFHQSCAKVYVPAQSTLEHLEKKGLRNLEIWSRGVDTACYHPRTNRQNVLKSYQVNPDKFILLYVGRLAPEKNVGAAIEAFVSLQPDVRSRTHLIIAGDGPSAETLRESYKEVEGITFTGFVQGTPLAELYAAADVFLFPSATETFGNVVLEAMASGTAVVGAAAGGVQDIIQHGRTGILCPPGDVRAFAHAVEQMLMSPEVCDSLAAAGRAYAIRQSWDHINSRLFAGIEEVIHTGIANNLHGARIL